eukprot:sb/3464585/
MSVGMSVGCPFGTIFFSLFTKPMGERNNKPCTVGPRFTGMLGGWGERVFPVNYRDPVNRDPTEIFREPARIGLASTLFRVLTLCNNSYTRPFLDEGSRSSCRVSEKMKRWLLIATLAIYGCFTSVCCSIRYGKDRLRKRITEMGMKRWGSRTLMFLVSIAFSVASLATGLVYLIESNLVVIIISTILRIIHGILAYASSLLALDLINAKLSTDFDSCNGIFCMGVYVGHGLSESMGCVLYDNMGYVAPFVFSSTSCLLSAFLVLAFIPAGRTYLATQDKCDNATMKLVNPKNTLTKYLVFPLFACMLINANYGVLQVTVTPYLHEEFHKSFSYGGLVLTAVSTGMALGSLLSGMVTFPPVTIPFLYDNSPILAFPGVFIAGVGDPMVTIATLRCLYEMQLQQSGMLTPRSTTLISGIWLMGYSAFYYSGSTIAGILTDYLVYYEIALILAGR